MFSLSYNFVFSIIILIIFVNIQKFLSVNIHVNKKNSK